ncbi:MAG: 2-amino-4-hydroxy-6-hydroxymethyldihydropteridine diphosphokinase [Verrucomicrobia bacterium]|nr:2-amino-4-hydroxy-6-hydroxymethyldihydropteridine diphosphokinase [Verrucomicrobiota bacterium]
MTSQAVDILIALGANLGEPEAQLREAFDELRGLSSTPLRTSSLWSSTPDNCPPGSPRFVNAVAIATPFPGDTPESWLDRLQALERQAGRRPKVVLNEARPLDLDLIAWGDLILESPRLVLPHPRAHQRRFVLAPLAELVPHRVLIGHGRTVAELLAAAPEDSGLRRL